MRTFKLEPQWKDVFRKYSSNGRLITGQVQVTDARIVSLKMETNVESDVARKGVKIDFGEEVGLNMSH